MATKNRPKARWIYRHFEHKILYQKAYKKYQKIKAEYTAVIFGPAVYIFAR